MVPNHCSLAVRTAPTVSNPSVVPPSKEVLQRRPTSRTRSRAFGLALDFTEVVSEPILDISRFVEAARHQRFDPILCGGSS